MLARLGNPPAWPRYPIPAAILLARNAPPRLYACKPTRLSRQPIESLAGFTDVDGLSEFDTDAAMDEEAAIGQPSV